MLNEALRAATALRGWRVLRTVMTFFLVSAMVVFGTQVIVGHPAVAKDAVINTPVTPENQSESDLYVSDLTLRRVGDNSGKLPLLVNDTAAEVKLKWSNAFADKQETRPVAGKKFTLELPEVLFFYAPALTPGGATGTPTPPVKMKHENGSVVGECTFEPRKVTCQFNEEAERLWEQGTRNFKGEFSSWAVNAVPTDGAKTTETFKVGGKDIEITLPGGIINDQAGPLTGTPWYKSANSLRDGSDAIYWFFKFTGPYLKEQFAAKGINQVMDGNTPFTIVLRDIAISDPLHFPKEQSLSFSRVVPKGTCTMEQVIKNKRGTECGNVTEKVQNATFEFKLDPNDPKRAEIHITAPFDENTAYTVSNLKTLVVGNVATGPDYKNTAQLFLKQPDGTLKEVNSAYERTAKVDNKVNVTVQFDQNSGSFELEKGVKGDIFGVDPNVPNVFEYKYELPAGTTFNDWKTLEPLKAESKNVTENSGVATMTVLPFKKGVPEMTLADGKKVAVAFPIGTKIVVSELLDGATPIKNVAAGEQNHFWGQPAYFVGDAAKAPEFEVKQGLTKLRVDNVVELGVPVLVEKKWDGVKDGQNLPEKIVFNYVCTVRGGQDINGSFEYKVKDGGKQAIGYFKAGTECRLTEDVAGLVIDGVDPAVKWDRAADNDPATGIASADKDDEKNRTVGVTNSYTPRVGTFKVQKKVVGVEADAANGKPFKFQYTCEDGQAGELEAPGNGDAVSSGMQFPIGTKCSITEVGAVDPIENHVLAIQPPAQTVTIAADAPTAVFTNTYNALGTFEVVKNVEGVDEIPLLEAKTYEFEYICNVRGETEAGKIAGVKHNGTPTPAGKSFPKGTTCEVTEIADKAQIDGYTAAPHSKVSVVIGGPNEPVVKAEFLNKYTRDTASFKLRKAVTGEDRFAADHFKVEYRCDEGDWKFLNLSGNGAWVEIEGIKTGSKCEVREDREAAERLGYALAVNYEYANGQVVQKDKPVEVTVKNNYTPIDGDFVIAKSVEGDVSEAIRNKEFTFQYKCTQPNGEVKKDEVKLKGGETKKIVGIQQGSACELEETNGAVDNTDWTVNVELFEGDILKPAAAQGEAPKPNAEVAANPVAEKLLAQDNEAEGDNKDVAPADEAAATDETSKAPAPAEEAPANAETPKVEAPEVAPLGEVDGKKAKFTVMGQPIAVAYTNKYVQHFGGLSVAKAVTGDVDDAMRQKTFTFNVKCANGMTDTLTVPGDGKAVTSQLKLPVGTTCDIEENVEEAKVAAFDLKAPAKQTVTISKRDEVVASTFTNEYTAHKGTFSVAKKVKGLPTEEAKSKEFTFNYECSDDQKGQVKAKGDGVAVDSGVMVRTGVECILTEEVESAEVKGYTLGLPEAHIVQVKAKDQKVEVTFTNEYVPDPKIPSAPEGNNPKPPSPWYLLPFLPLIFGGGNNGSSTGSHSTTPAPNSPQAPQGKNAPQKGVLASTGASVIGLGLLALVITSAGILLAVRGRKNNG